MSRLGFRWTEWSTPPVTLTIIVSSWALALLLAALFASLVGFSGFAQTAAALGKAFFAGGLVLLTIAGIAGIAYERRASARRGAVERPVHR